jgi:hypothetical protein
MSSGMLRRVAIVNNRRLEGTSVLTRASRHNLLEDCTLHSHRRENLKPYMNLFIVKRAEFSHWSSAK